jgi:hypothetical protein
MIAVDNCIINQIKSAICNLSKDSKMISKSKSSLEKQNFFIYIILLFLYLPFCIISLIDSCITNIINTAAKIFLILWICDISNRSVRIECRDIKIRDCFISRCNELNKTFKTTEIILLILTW